MNGLQAGAYYYLTKPFEKNKLLAIMKTALSDYQRYCVLQDETERTRQTLVLMNKGYFEFCTLNEGRDIVTLLANAIPGASNILMGLSELVVNAVEHGNLGITYADKSRLNEEGIWEQEVERRLALPENNNKSVILEFDRSEDQVTFFIQDQGSGFDWQNYLEISPDRAFDNHGRGIAMANMLSFDHLEYRGNGNQLLAVISLKGNVKYTE